MIDMKGGHYGIILETRKNQNMAIYLVEDDSGIQMKQLTCVPLEQ